jgi:predicted dinucleotide-binding enzyme
MTSVSIFGLGKMGLAVTDIVARGGASIQIVKHSEKSDTSRGRSDAEYAVFGDDLTGDLVILAVPQAAHRNIVEEYRDRLDGKVIIDISNAIDFSVNERPEALRGTSAALELAKQLPVGVPVLKAFNVNLADTLKAGTNGATTTTVLVAGDDAAGKTELANLIEAAGLRAVDAGPLPRSRELEALGFLQIVMAASGKTQYESGFTLLP